MTGHVVGWERCPGSALPLVMLGERAGRCSVCRWVGWVGRAVPDTAPAHSRPVMPGMTSPSLFDG